MMSWQTTAIQPIIRPWKYLTSIFSPQGIAKDKSSDVSGLYGGYVGIIHNTDFLEGLQKRKRAETTWGAPVERVLYGS